MSAFDEEFSEPVVFYPCDLCVLSREDFPTKRKALAEYKRWQKEDGACPIDYNYIIKEKDLEKGWVKFRGGWMDGEFLNGWWECGENVKGAKPVWILGKE